jgi:hypothetical protein
MIYPDPLLSMITNRRPGGPSEAAEVSGAPKGLLKRFVILLPILRKRFYNCVVEKEMQFEILLASDDDPPVRRDSRPGRPRGQTPLVQSAEHWP